LTDPTPDFDAEKRRRWYAVLMGLTNATITMTISFVQYGFETGETLSVYFGFWVLIAVITFVAAYAVWWREYSSKIRAVTVSCLCIALFALALSALNFLIYGSYNFYGHADILNVFVSIHKDLFGLPYVGAAIIGWRFARPVPDVRNAF
jgi:riboflavin transporter FmnP